MKKHNLAFIDLETTGFDPVENEIIEIAGLIAKQVPQTGRGAKLEVLGEFEYKIKPERLETADPEALRINGYNELEWMFAPNLAQVMKDVAGKTEAATFVAHNLTFDWRFLNEAFKKTGVKNKMHFAKIDTLSLAFGKLYHKPEVDKFSLKALTEYFGIKNNHAHTALADVRAMFEIYKKLLEI